MQNIIYPILFSITTCKLVFICEFTLIYLFLVNWHEQGMCEDQQVCENEDSWGGSECCSKERKGKRLWKKVKYQLVEYHSLPGYLRDNEFIIGHYRSEWPLKQVLLSIFTIHNETLNVWT